MIRLLSLLLPFVAFSLACERKLQTEETLQGPQVRHVDPFIGTAEHGHVYPGASAPFGAIQLSPDNGTQSWDWCSGYNWIDSVIVGFSHTHLSGTGIGDLCDLLVMPTLAQVDFSRIVRDPKDNDFAVTFSHDNESASPGYYQVLLDNGIRSELSASTRVGYHRHTFPEEAPAPSIVLDLGYAINWDRPTDTELRRENDTLFTGFRHSTGWARDQRLFFALVFSSPVEAFELADSNAMGAAEQLRGQRVRAQFRVRPDARRQVQLKVAISSASVEGAKAALVEIPHWDFDRTRAEVAETWNRELSKITVLAGDPEYLPVFYTALYRTALAPVIFSDAQGRYKGPDGHEHRARGYTRYDIFSLWDTFRAAHPLYTLTQPDKVNDFIRSFLDHYEQHGLLPVWSLLGNETNTMTGYHAVPVIVDAYLKGFRDYDVNKAFEAMLRGAGQDIRGTSLYRKYGYIPHDKHGQSVTKTLEYAYDDWCIAQMAGALDKMDTRDEFLRRAAYYRNLFDPQTGFMRAKNSDGRWKTPFDPKYSDHNFEVAEYTEGNAWQHSFFVPHDVKGLIDLLGGEDAFVDKLEALFATSSEITGDNISSDISGLIGQYAHGNEPSHHIAYMYNYAGRPWKTQERVRQILLSQYDATPAGLCGNEDCGQMSAWYVFSALGFYPVNPAEGIYVIGSPLFERVRLQLAGGKTFTVEAKNASRHNKYIQSASLNGRSLERSYIRHGEIVNGGTLSFVMGPAPNYSLWTEEQVRPPSMR